MAKVLVGYDHRPRRPRGEVVHRPQSSVLRKIGLIFEGMCARTVRIGTERGSASRVFTGMLPGLCLLHSHLDPRHDLHVAGLGRPEG
jgi:hypothetical protein